MAKLAEISEMAFAERIAEMLEHEFILTETQEWMCYDGRRWLPRMTRSLHRAVGMGMRSLRREMLAAGIEAKSCVPNRGKVMAVSAHLGDLLYEATNLETFDASPDQLNVANGVLDLETGELHDHHYSQRFTYCLDTPYSPKQGKAYSAWMQFLEQSVDPEALPLLQTAVGYSLTGNTWEEKMFYIYGPTRAGKGVFSETLLTLFTKALATEVEFNTFTRDRDNDANNFDLAPLKPARLIFASESNRTSRLNDAKVKALTGGNMVRCSFKFGEHFSYKPQFKIWLTSNYDVNADPNDDAVWNRIIRFPFPNTHEGNTDTTLKWRFRQPEMQQAVLTWAVEGARLWYENGLVVPRSLAQEAIDVRDELDMVQAWLEECTVRDAEAFQSNATLHTSYEEWCKRHGLKPFGTVGLSRVLVTKGYPQARTAKQRGFKGLAMVPEGIL